MAQKHNPVEAYLDRLNPENRAALDRLRSTIRATAPEAEECITYGIPAFRFRGKFLVGLGVATNHCSFYPGAVVSAFGKELEGYDTSKGTVRFRPEKPLPSGLVRKIVKARIAKLGLSKKAPKREVKR